MVIGHEFAWAHLPKTGGNATLAFFDLFPHLIVSADRRDSRLTHTYFPDRADEVSGKQLVLGIRRLPAWMLSRAHYRTRHGAYPDYVPLPMESPHQMAESSHADRVLRSFTAEGRFQIDRWLRMEFLESDFLDFISQFTDVAETEKQRIMELGRVMTEGERRRVAKSGEAFELEYDREISHWFTEEQIRRMYENNPVWSAAEGKAYGEVVEPARM
jgi:hypothetical protein